MQQIEFAGGRRTCAAVCLRLKEGENVTSAALQDSVIYNTGYFDDAVIERFPMDGRDPATAVNDPKAPLRIIVSVIEKPSIRSVSLEAEQEARRRCAQ